jgi:hypothetical protein
MKKKALFFADRKCFRLDENKFQRNERKCASTEFHFEALHLEWALL